MSVRRLVATMDTSGVNVSEFCLSHGLSRQTFYLIRRRYRLEGESGLEPRSRAPLVVANTTSVDVEEQIVRIRKQLSEDGLDCGAATIQWHLSQAGVLGVPSVSTIWRILKARGFVVDDPSKAPHGEARSFQADRANEVWQIDGTGWELASGVVVKIVNVIDDGSRLCVASRVYEQETLDAVWGTFLAGSLVWGLPERVLSDNGKGLRAMTKPLASIGVTKGHSRPYHPQTCGKVERFHFTMKKWLGARPRPETISDLQDLVDVFCQIYNHERPHRSIGRMVPAKRWEEMPKSGPKKQPLTVGPSQQIAQRRVSSNGLVAFSGTRISVGIKHALRQATVIATGDQAHVFIGADLIRELDLDPAADIHPLHATRGRPKKT